MKRLLFISLFCLINTHVYGMVDSLSSMLKAIQNNNFEEVKKAEENLNLGAVTEQGYTPLMVAVKKKFEEETAKIINFLLEKMSPAEINQKNKKIIGQTALMIAIKVGNAKAAELIINHLNKINTEEALKGLYEQDEHGNNALMYAITVPRTYKATMIPVIVALIKNKVDINAQNKKDNTALILAIQNRFDEAIKIILNDHTINVTQKGEDGKNALMEAIEQRNEEIALLLITAMDPKDLQAQDNYGNTALMYAAKNYWGDTTTKGENIIKALLEKNQNTIRQQNNYQNSALFLAIKAKNNVIAQFLIEKSSVTDLNSIKNIDSYNALFYAINQGNMDVVKMLLDKKVNIAIQTEDGSTPVIFAINLIPEYGLEVAEIAILLINATPTNVLNIQVGLGATALIMTTLIMGLDQNIDLKKILELLISKKVDLNKKITDKIPLLDEKVIPKGSTALDIAKIFGNQEVIDILQNAQKETSPESKKPSKKGELLKSIANLNHTLNSLSTRLKK